MYTNRNGKDTFQLPVTNGDTAKLIAGQPVRWKIASMDGKTVQNFAAFAIDHFAGIMLDELAASGSHGHALLVEGEAPVNFKNHASAAVGTYARPVPGTTYFTYSAWPTGIILLTAQTSGTDVHSCLEATPPRVLVLPNALKNVVYWESPDVADPDGILDGQTIAAEGQTVLAAGMLLATMDVPRNVIVQPKTNTGDVAAGNVVLVGTDGAGASITENLAFLENATDATVSLAAYSTIVSVTWPAQDGATATWDVGFADVLGMPFIFQGVVAPNPVRTILNGVVEGTAPAIIANAALSKNTIDLNSALSATELRVELPY